MGFLLNIANQGENRLVGVNGYFLPIGRNQCPGAVTVILHHAEHREGNAHLVKCPLCRLGVNNAAVNQQQIRRGIKALVYRLEMDKASLHHLIHGGIVVLIFKPLHLEALIVALFWLPILEHHHTGHNVRAGDIGNIEGLDAPGGRNPQHFSQQRQYGAVALLLVGDPSGLLQRIFAGQLHQAGIVPPLGHPKLGGAAKLLLHQRRKQLPILQRKRQQHVLGGKAPAEVKLLHQAGNRLLLVVRGGKHLIFLVQQIAAAEMQHRKAGLHFRLSIAHHVRIRQRPRRHQLLLPQGFHRAQPVTEGSRQFKFQIICRRQHLLFDFLGHGLIIAAE